MMRLKNLLELYGVMSNVDVSRDMIPEFEGDRLFKFIVADYIQGIVSVDDLSALCEMCYGKLSINSDLHGLLLSGAEIEWDIRHTPLSAASSIETLIRKFS